ncbi:MAG: diiron oxygenase [Symploca sp. SIO2B6]|nr:diiron oxygenase [Symploca sp. SIO2B6]
MNLIATSLTSESQKQYESPFKDWDESSWIRSKPLREVSFSGLLFRPELTPLAWHPKISKEPDLYKAILAYRLLENIQLTSLIELNYVNPICRDLVQEKTVINLTKEQRLDALKIYCDEGGHSFVMEWFVQQVETISGLNHKVLEQPHFELNFQKLVDAEYNLSPNLIKLFMTTILETLYVEAYSAIPQDERIAPAVRAVIEDHITDENKHDIYFRGIFTLLWNSLSELKKEQVGQLLPKMVRTFLEPDQIAAHNILQYLGFSTVDSDRILEEVYVPEKITQNIRRAAKPVLRMFEESGVFSISSVKQGFENYQLIA